MTVLKKLSLAVIVSFLLYPNAVQADTSSKVAYGAKPKTAAGACFAKKCLGVALGAFVGPWVCVVRKPITEEKFGIAQMNGYNHDLRVVIPAAIFYSPIAVFTAVIESPFWGFGDAVRNFNNPFSKEQFSLGDIEKPDTVVAPTAPVVAPSPPPTTPGSAR